MSEKRYALSLGTGAQFCGHLAFGSRVFESQMANGLWIKTAAQTLKDALRLHRDIAKRLGSSMDELTLVEVL